MTPKIYAVKLDNVLESDNDSIYSQNLKAVQNCLDVALISQALRRYTINKEFGVPFDKMRFSNDKNGKPFLVGYENIHFNISHSGNIFACAVYCKAVGLDVQKHDKELSPRLAQRVFSKKENDLLNNLPMSGKRQFYFDMWAKHESLVKFSGLGLSQIFSADDKNRVFEYSHGFDGYSLCICY